MKRKGKNIMKLLTPKPNLKKLVEQHKIYIFCDSALSSVDRLLVYDAISEIKQFFPMCKIVNLDTVAGEGKETNRKIADSFLKGSFNEIARASCNIILDRLQKVRDTLPDCYAVVLITWYDLYIENPKVDWVFGAARVKNRVTVQSMFRYRNLTEEEKLRCIRRTLRHELGHNFGMAADLNRVNTEDHTGPHCTAPGCSMRQAGTLQKLLELSAEEKRVGTYFCKDCISDMNKTFDQFISKK